MDPALYGLLTTLGILAGVTAGVMGLMLFARWLLGNKED